MSVRMKALTLTVLFGAAAALCACGKQGSGEKEQAGDDPVRLGGPAALDLVDHMEHGGSPGWLAMR